MKIPKVLKYRCQLLLIVLPFLITSIWFGKGLLFATAEEGIPFYNLSNHINLISTVWYEVGTGFPLVTLLPRIPFIEFLVFLNRMGLSPVLLQAMTFWLITTAATISSYALTKYLLSGRLKKGLKEKASVVAGIFYLLNPYTLSQVFGRSLYGQMFALALLPPFLYLVIRGLRERKIYFAVGAVVASFIFAPAFVMPTEIVVIWAPVLVYFAYQSLIFLSSKKFNDFLHTLFYFIFLVLLWTLVHSWWLVPMASGVGGQVFAINADNLEENLGTLRGVSEHFPLPLVLRLMQSFYFFVSKTYGDIYFSLPFELISWLIPLCGFFGLSYLKKIRDLRFFLILFLIGLFVSLGANFPFGAIFVWFFSRFTFLQAFRNPYEKFGLVFLFAYTPFFALGLSRLPKQLRASALFLVCGVFVWPLWMGSFAGKNAWTKVPSYYREADNWLNSQMGDFRIMQMPLISNDAVLYNWEFPYQGIEPGEFLFTRGSIGRNVIVNKIYYNVLLQRFGNFYPNSFAPDPDISQSTFRSENLWQELAKLNVRFIVFHNDLDDASIGVGVTTKDFKDYLVGEEKIKKVKTFGELDIYEVKIPEEIALIYSPQAKVEYEKISPAHYEVYVKSAGNLDLYFLKQFVPGWEATINGIKLENHTRIFDYANAWTLEQKGDCQVSIKYRPQESLVKGLKISRYALFSSLGYLVLVFLKKTTSA